MRGSLLTGILAIVSLSAAAQPSERVAGLLDSARFYQYVDFNKAIQTATQAEKLIQAAGAESNPVGLIGSYLIRTESCQAFARFQQWRQYLGKADSLLRTYRKSLGASYDQLKLDHNRSEAQYYYEINNLQKSTELFTALMEELGKQKESPAICEQLYVFGNYLASIHQLNGEYEASVNQHLASIRQYECSRAGTTGPSYVSLIYRNIGNVYLEKREYIQAGKYLKIAEDSLQSLLKSSSGGASGIAISLYEAQASYYSAIHKPDSARLALQKILPLVTGGTISDEFKGRYELSVAELYRKEGNLKAAVVHYQLAETSFLRSANRNVYLANVYLSRANLAATANALDDALDFCERAIDILKVDAPGTNTGSPSPKRILSKKLLFEALQRKSNIEERMASNRKDVEHLIQSYGTNQLSLALLDSTLNEFSLDNDKMLLADRSYSGFEDGIRLASTLYSITRQEQYLNEAFTLMDRSKGFLLLENLRLVNRFAGISTEWLDTEKGLKAELREAEKALYEASGGNDDLPEVRERYAALKRSLSELMTRIKREAPNYYQLRFDHSVVTVPDLKNRLLKPGEALIEFFMGDSIVAIAGFTRNNQFLEVKKAMPELTRMILSMRDMLSKPGAGMDPAYAALSDELFDYLLKDCLAGLGPGVSSITLVPDGLLGYLPFEALTDSGVFLNDRFPVHYANSATYLFEQLEGRPSDAPNFFAGFVGSPSGQTEAGWDPLKGAESEVASITGLWNSGFKVFNPAAKTDFLKYAGDYKVLHFAMHSVVNDQNPMLSRLIFSAPDKDGMTLNAIDLYSMHLNSDLAVLSACNTGVGQLHRGEGIMSFSRAFAYAGVPSAVISLWKVPDLATSQIMVSFYKYLEAGKPKDIALQLARQDFMKNNPEMKNPYFWSGFILTGNPAPISFPGSFPWRWIALGVLVAGVGFYGQKKFRNSRKVSL